MKIEFDIKDIEREEVIEAMAGQLLSQWHEEDDPETGPTAYHRATPLGQEMKKYLDKKIEGLANVLVREQFDTAIAERITSAIDAVLAEGWQVTNTYGEVRGPKVDLKARITEVLTAADRYDSNNKLIDKQIKAAVEKTLDKEFKGEIEAAKTKVRQQLDGVLSGKVTEALKSAMGLK